MTTVRGHSQRFLVPLQDKTVLLLQGHFTPLKQSIKACYTINNKNE